MTWVLLAVAVVGTVVPPWREQRWVVPVLALATGVLLGAVDAPGSAVRPLLAPVAFLLAAVPLAVLLEQLGFFAAMAGRVGSRPWRLWVLGAIVTTLLNLDTAVVLLTPLYARIDRRLALQPVLLALVASSALPVSNLTNLIAASGADLSTLALLGHLGVPSLVATIVGWWRYRRVVLGGERAAPTTPNGGKAVGLDRVAGAVVVLVVLGFVSGLAPWAVASAAVVLLALRARRVPWRALPVGTGIAVLALGALASSAAAHLDLHRAAGVHGPAGVVVVAALSAMAANVFNNLPTALVAVRAIGHGPGLWPALLGVNMGPFLLVTGSLASLLWLESTRSLGSDTSPRDFTLAGIRIVGPSFAAAVATMAVLTLTPWW